MRLSLLLLMAYASVSSAMFALGVFTMLGGFDCNCDDKGAEKNILDATAQKEVADKLAQRVEWQTQLTTQNQAQAAINVDTLAGKVRIKELQKNSNLESGQEIKNIQERIISNEVQSTRRAVNIKTLEGNLGVVRMPNYMTGKRGLALGVVMCLLFVAAVGLIINDSLVNKERHPDVASMPEKSTSLPVLMKEWCGDLNSAALRAEGIGNDKL